MKQFKFLFVALLAIMLASCGEGEGISLIKGNVVVNQTMLNEGGDTNYRYKVEFNSYAGTAMLLTNYRYEVGDTLFCKYELKESNEYLKHKIDSLELVNSSIKKDFDKILYQNELLSEIIQELKSK